MNGWHFSNTFAAEIVNLNDTGLVMVGDEVSHDKMIIFDGRLALKWDRCVLANVVL